METANSGLSFARDQLGPDTDRRQLARQVPAGNLVRLAKGAYFPTDVWNRLGAKERYLALIAAVRSTIKGKPVLSHMSAAVLWGLPSIGDWPQAVHVTVNPATGTRSRNQIVRHAAALADEDIVDFDSYYLTSRARTILDIAATSPFLDAVVIADRALLMDRFSNKPPMVTRDELEAAWTRAHPLRAHSRTRAVFAFAETSAESPLESISRVHMRLIGVPRPRLQVPHYDSRGFIGAPDFTWDEFGLVGEADGDVKYTSAELRGGRSAEQVVIDEKVREDRFRALPRRVTRWRWNIAINPAALRARLTDAGLPIGRKW